MSWIFGFFYSSKFINHKKLKCVKKNNDNYDEEPNIKWTTKQIVQIFIEIVAEFVPALVRVAIEKWNWIADILHILVLRILVCFMHLSLILFLIIRRIQCQLLMAFFYNYFDFIFG